MPYGLRKIILIRAGRYDYAEVEIGGSLHIVGRNNIGKTTLINTLQFFYIDDRRHMNFGAYTPEQTRDYYFPDQYSYVLFESRGARGTSVLGWRGQSKASSGEPERFHFEGPFDRADFMDDGGQVREPRAISAHLSVKHYTALKSAQEHRDFLLLPTKGEPRGTGLVALRDNDKYAQFRETLKNLLCLSTITQDQMRDRLLMLAGIPTAKYALDVRKLFGDDYDRILRLKQKLVSFKKHQGQIAALIDYCVRRDTLRCELMYRWSNMREKRLSFEREHGDALKSFDTSAEAANRRAEELSDELEHLRESAQGFSEAKGGFKAQLAEIAEQAEAHKDFVEGVVQASLLNSEAKVRRLVGDLRDAAEETRERAEANINTYEASAKQKRLTIAHFDRALITVLRADMSDAEIAPLTRLFAVELLHLPVGDDGVRLRDRDQFFRALRALNQRIDDGVYRDANVELPLPAIQDSIARLDNLDDLQKGLVEDERALARWRSILKAVLETEDLKTELRRQQDELERLNKRLFEWNRYQAAKARQPRLAADLKRTEESVTLTNDRIRVVERDIHELRRQVTAVEKNKAAEELSFNAVIARYNTCVFPEYSGSAAAPDEVIPDGFDASIGLFLRHQRKLIDLDEQVREGFRIIESALGSDFTGADNSDSVRLLREELEALPEREEALGRDWNHQFHQLRATFDEVLRAFDDIKSAAVRLDRGLSAVQVSNLEAVSMVVVDQIDLVTSLRKLASLEQPDLYDNSAGLEATLGAFRKKFEASPLLRYADLFTLRFTVTGDDGKPHHYDDFKQVESHGTTITIKVLFNLLVLRGLLREDSTRSLLCEIPFFLDEIHSLDADNRQAVLAMARKLGFVAITAAPEPVSEVDALYFLQSKHGRIVLLPRHRIAVKPGLAPA